jgi:ubiquinone/menaquinone biosynthesis C-methylase UbiE
MNSNYYFEYYELERKHWWFRVRAEIIMEELQKVLPSDGGLKILNVGAATGRTSELLAQFGAVTSVEYEKDCCAFVKEKLGIDYINASITELPFEDETFDLVCAFDVIEHIEDDKKGVAELIRVCKKGGTTAVTVPAFMSLWSHHDVVNHHFRRYEQSEISKLFAPFDGKSIRETYFNSLLFTPILIFRTLSKFIPKFLIRKGAGSDFSVVNQESFVNKLTEKVFRREKQMLLSGKNFQKGVSFLYFWRKSM